MNVDHTLPNCALPLISVQKFKVDIVDKFTGEIVFSYESKPVQYDLMDKFFSDAYKVFMSYYKHNRGLCLSISPRCDEYFQSQINF